MVKQYKIDEVENLVSRLNEKRNIVLTRFTGTKVSDLNQLRRDLKEKGADYRVIKNSLFRRALKETGHEAIGEYVKGPIAVALTDDDIGEVAKVLVDFQKKHKHFGYSIGVMANVIYDENDIKKIAGLPSRDVLISMLMSLINGPATNFAMATNQVIASLARGIKAVAEKNSQ